ncbi:MAG: DinB family protein [bacterium]
MLTLLRDLYGHQEWADAELWRAIEALPTAMEDTALRARLHHIFLVQSAFLSVVQKERFIRSRAEDFSELSALKGSVIAVHKKAAGFLASCSEAQLEEIVTVPWFRNPPVNLPIRLALMQAAMHSHYHRGQNATRLRELGGEPPLTDLIVWYWKNKPEAQWES